MDQPIIRPYAGFEIEPATNLLRVDLIEFCERWEQIDPTGSLDEEQINDLVALTLLDYNGFIESVIFTGCILDTVFEFNTLEKLIQTLACRNVRPASIQLSLDSDNHGPKAQERLRRVVEFNRYLTDWTLDCQESDFNKLMPFILRPFVDAKHLDSVTVIKSGGSDDAIDFDSPAFRTYGTDLRALIVRGVKWKGIVKMDFGADSN